MGDDNEIRQLIRRESEAFLHQARKQTTDLGTRYDFEAEFSRTKKNRQLLVTFVTLATIVLFGGAAFLTARLIQERTRSMPVDVQAFEDINLRDLLDTAKRNESDLERAKLELKALEDELAAELAGADRDLRSNLDSIRSLGLAADAEARRQAEARNLAEAKKRDARNRLNPLIAAKRAEVAAIQERIDQYDQKLGEQAKRQQAVLENERRLFDEEKKRLVRIYETRIADLESARSSDVAAMRRQREELQAALTARWNPTLQSDRDLAALGDVPPRQPLRELPPLPTYLRGLGFLPAEAEARIARSTDDFNHLMARLRATSYVNSVPQALKRLDEEARRAALEYRGALQASAKGLQDRDKSVAELRARAETAEAALARYAFAVSEYVRSNTEGGYVIDPRDRDNILVSINPAIPVAEGGKGYVFRSTEQPIATLVFSYRGGRLVARVAELQKGQRLQPFDPILVELAERPITPPAPPPPPEAPAQPEEPQDGQPAILPQPLPAPGAKEAEGAAATGDESPAAAPGSAEPAAQPDPTTTTGGNP